MNDSQLTEVLACGRELHTLTPANNSTLKVTVQPCLKVSSHFPFPMNLVFLTFAFIVWFFLSPSCPNSRANFSYFMFILPGCIWTACIRVSTPLSPCTPARYCTTTPAGWCRAHSRTRASRAPAKSPPRTHRGSVGGLLERNGCGRHAVRIGSHSWHVHARTLENTGVNFCGTYCEGEKVAGIRKLDFVFCISLIFVHKDSLCMWHF